MAGLAAVLALAVAAVPGRGGVADRAAAADRATVAGRMVGLWQSLDDPASQRRFDADGRTESRYDGALLAAGRYWLARRCGGRLATGSDPFVAVSFDGETEPYCYVVHRLEADRLQLIYLPRGNLLRYRRVAE